MNEYLFSCIQKRVKVNIELTSSLKIKDDLGFDSYDMMSLIIDLESYYNIRLDIEELSKVETINDLDVLITRLLA